MKAESRLDHLYEKRKEELRVSHLMIRPDSSGVEAAQDFANSLLDSIKNGASFEEMVKLDIHYLKNWSLWLDIKIILRTIPVMLKGEGC